MTFNDLFSFSTSKLNIRSSGIVASMFDESGNMGRPWAAHGYAVHCYDVLNDDRVEPHSSGGSITFHKADLRDVPTLNSIAALKPDILFGFPPCTDLALSGTRHFEAKRAVNPEFQNEAVALARSVEFVGNKADCPWFAENPKSVLSTKWRQFNYRFDPYEYGGYLPVDDVHPRWPTYIMPRDAYPKETWLWTSHDWTMPPTKPVKVAVGYSQQFQKLGGKSARTKQIRSETPRGFALAVFQHYNGMA